MAMGRRLTFALSLTLVYLSSGSVSCPQALLWKQYRGTATATRDLNGILIMFPESSVNAPDAHSVRIDSERIQIGVNAHHNRLKCAYSLIATMSSCPLVCPSFCV